MPSLLRHHGGLDIALKNLANLFENMQLGNFQSQNTQAIRIQLLSSLLIPLLILWVISAAIAYCFAVRFANDAYDRELINSADSIAARLQTNGTRVWADIPPAAQAILHYNRQDQIYYQVLRKDGSRLIGDAIIPGPVANLQAEEPVFRNAVLDGKNIRIGRIRVQMPSNPNQVVLVQVAETLNARQKLAEQILLSIMIPQCILILLGAASIWRGVTKSLIPLKNLTDAISKRSQTDLTPVSESDAPKEVRPLVTAINDLLLRLKSEIESQKRFVANAAHQFRTPLAALKTYIYYAKRLSVDNEMDSVLDKIDISTERMTHLSNKLLALAKAEPANRFDQFKQVNLNYIVSEITASFASVATKKNLEVTFSGLDSPALVCGDPENLAELVTNLIENAILYTNPGGRVAVRIANGEEIKLIVEDNGCGIPNDEREQVFERFYRVLGTNAPGSGLGLPIVKEIANAHGARVCIEAGGSGVGTNVTVYFPAASPNIHHLKI